LTPNETFPPNNPAFKLNVPVKNIHANSPDRLQLTQQIHSAHDKNKIGMNTLTVH